MKYFQSPNEDINDSDMEENTSEIGESVGTDKLDPADRELYEKLKRQEREEREEIEKELKRAHEEAIIRRHEELRAKELRLHSERLQQLESERGQDLRVNKQPVDGGGIEFRPHREGGVLPLSKSDIDHRLDFLTHSAILAERFHRNSLSPQSPTSISPIGDGPSHHWTFEEQFKQVDFFFNFERYQQ